jgi:hypothetical protein
MERDEHMGFMQPTAEYFTAYHVDTNAGTEIVPEDVCGALPRAETGLCPICGVNVTLNGETTDGRLIGTCGDAFTETRWLEDDERVGPHLRDYLEDQHIHSVERKQGWYARLSADGYLDCTGWDGPYDTSKEALDAVKELYDVDDEGDLTEEGAEDVVTMLAEDIAKSERGNLT